MKVPLWLKLIIIAAGVFLASVFLPKLACATGEYINSPWWFVVFNPNCATDSTWKILARGEYWEGAGDCVGYYYIDSAKGRNPSLKWTTYLSILDGHAKGSAQANWYEVQFDSEGCGSFCEESLYYHYWNNHGAITGWKNLADSAKYHSRVPFSIDAGRFMRNNTNTVSRKMTIKYIIKQQMDSIKTANNDYTDGLFVDNGGYTGISVWFELNAGDTLWETYQGNKITNKTSQLEPHEWNNGRRILYQKLFDTLFIDGHLWSKDTTDLVIELNTGSHWMKDYYKDSICNRTDNEGLHNVFNIADNGSGRPWHIYKQLDSIQDQAFPIAYEWEIGGENNDYPPNSPAGGGGDLDDTINFNARFSGLPVCTVYDQITLDNLSLFWATRAESTDFRNRFAGTIPASAGWDSLAWHPIMDTLERFNFPVDTIKRVANALDSIGDSVGIWCRTWTNNQGGSDSLYTCARCRHLWNQGAGQNTAYTFNLPSSGWKAFDAHGNLSNSLSTAWLRNGQAALFIKYGSGTPATGKKVIRGRFKKG